MKARPLDNLEFAQWMKHYYDTATSGMGVASYDAKERREVSARSAAAAAPGGGAAAKKRACPCATMRFIPTVPCRDADAACARCVQGPRALHPAPRGRQRRRA